AIDELDDEIGLASGCDASIVEPRDARMGEPGQERAFAAETRHAARAEQRCTHELDGDPALEAPIGPMGEPYRAHAALPERALERVGPDFKTLEARRLGPLVLVPIGHRFNLLPTRPSTQHRQVDPRGVAAGDRDRQESEAGPAE